MNTFSLENPFCLAPQENTSVFQAIEILIIIINIFFSSQIYIHNLKLFTTITEDLTLYIHGVTPTKKPITFLIHKPTDFA